MKLLMYSVCAGLTLYLHYPLYNSNKCFMYNQKMAIIERVPCSAAIGVTVTVGVCLLSRNGVRWYLTHHILVTPLLRAFTSWLWTLMNVRLLRHINSMTSRIALRNATYSSLPLHVNLTHNLCLNEWFASALCSVGGRRNVNVSEELSLNYTGWGQRSLGIVKGTPAYRGLLRFFSK